LNSHAQAIDGLFSPYKWKNHNQGFKGKTKTNSRLSGSDGLEKKTNTNSKNIPLTE